MSKNSNEEHACVDGTWWVQRGPFVVMHEPSHVRHIHIHKLVSTRVVGVPQAKGSEITVNVNSSLVDPQIDG